jgi:hypothetical protein
MDLFRIVPLIKTVWKLSSSLIGVNRQHDVAVFHKLDTILDESRIEKILKYSFFTECLRFEERELLYKFVDALQCVENQYLHLVIELRAKKLAWEMSQLLRTVGSTFWSDDGEIFRFRPDPIDPTAYDREWDKLHDGIEKTWKAYKTYREVVKDRLKV